jgi:hypothetical protein
MNQVDASTIAWKFSLIAALSLLPASIVAAQEKPPHEALLKTTEFLGCSGEPDREDLKPTARRLTNNDTVTFLVSAVDSCGLEGRNLKPIWKGDQLDLTFETYSRDGSIGMCYCEYWARFTFDVPAMYLPTVNVNGQEPVLMGEWPEGR